MTEAPARRPRGGTRLLLLAVTVAGFLQVLSLGFPPAAPDRLPVLVIAVGLALATAWRPERGLLAFSFLFPLAGVLDRTFGGTDALAWPVLLFAGFAAGWTFRFLYDFESAPDPSRLDGWLKALLAVWTLATILAVVRARTLWAWLEGLRLRAVNSQGLLDAEAVRESLMALAVLASGVGFFFLLRRAGDAARRRALTAALAGVGFSTAVAVAERLGKAPGETSEYWRITGRLSGGATDPNALGLLCGLTAALAVAALLSGRLPRIAALGLTALLPAGLVLSGSRSGLAAAALALLALAAAPRVPARVRLGVAVVGLAIGLAAGGALLGGARGSVGARLAEIFDRELPAQYRASARPLLWRGALRLFERHPWTGAGMGAFAWQLPDLAREEGQELPIRDNPGSAYLQALAETGAIGFLFLSVFAVAVAREAGAALSRFREDPLAAGAGGSLLGFLVALAAGSHWFAPDVALLFFLIAAVASRRAEPVSSRWPARARALALAAYAVAAVAGSLATLSAAEAFHHRPRMGFYPKETGPGGPFHWTARRFAVLLGPGEAARLTVAHYTPEGRSVELTADDDGRPVFRRTLEPGEGLTLSLSGTSARARILRFTLSRAFVPKRLGLSDDRRELGLVAVFPGGR